jgi:hypothetical protein
MFTEIKSKIIESENVIYRVLNTESETLEKGFSLSLKIDPIFEEKNKKSGAKK